MIQRLLWHIAGVDRPTLTTCPVTDKVWAAHLGFSLVLSFTVVLGISFHATGYVIADPWVRLLAATVVALTVFMFDRALYQSDWFYQGILQRGFDPAGPDDRPDRWRPLRRFFRITIRLTISFALAWIIAVFLELAIFSDTISEKVKRDHLAGNQPIFQKIEGYEAQLDREIEQRRQQLVAAEALYRRELGTTQPPEAAPPAQLDELEQQIKGLDAQEQELRGELRQLQGKITGYAEEMNAEEVGRKLNPSSSGRAGTGPRYTFAKQQRDVYTEQRAERERELRELAARREELRSTQGRIAADAAARRNQAREAVVSQRGALEAQVDDARRELAALEAARLAKIAEFRSQALAASDFQKLKDDPLSRMTAYQELKSDPKDGATITLFSWMTKFLVIFLEIVPVVAKMFFSPPSVYAARIQATVFRGREEAFRLPPEPAPRRAVIPEGAAMATRRDGATRAKAQRTAEAGPAAAAEASGPARDRRPQKPQRVQISRARANRAGSEIAAAKARPAAASRQRDRRSAKRCRTQVSRARPNRSACDTATAEAAGPVRDRSARANRSAHDAADDAAGRHSREALKAGPSAAADRGRIHDRRIRDSALPVKQVFQ